MYKTSQVMRIFCILAEHVFFCLDKDAGVLVRESFHNPPLI